MKRPRTPESSLNLRAASISGREKVDSSNTSAEACPRQRVAPKVTLEVQQRLAAHVAKVLLVEPDGPADFVRAERYEKASARPDPLSHAGKKSFSCAHSLGRLAARQGSPRFGARGRQT